MSPFSRGLTEESLSIATTQGVGEGATPFPGLLNLTLDTYLIMLSVKQGGIKYHFFKSLVWLDLGLNTGRPDHWRTLYPLDQWAGYHVIYAPQTSTNQNSEKPLTPLRIFMLLFARSPLLSHYVFLSLLVSLSLFLSLCVSIPYPSVCRSPCHSTPLLSLSLSHSLSLCLFLSLSLSLSLSYPIDFFLSHSPCLSSHFSLSLSLSPSLPSHSLSALSLSFIFCFPQSLSLSVSLSPSLSLLLLIFLLSD